MCSSYRLPRGRLKKLLKKQDLSDPCTEVPGSIVEVNNAVYPHETSQKTSEDIVGKPVDPPANDREPESDSDASSVGDHLIDPEKIDLDGPFFSATLHSQTYTELNATDGLLDGHNSVSVSSDSESKVEFNADEDDRMYEIFSQITDFERKVNEANNCIAAREQRTTGSDTTRKPLEDAFDIPSLLTQTEGIGIDQRSLEQAHYNWEIYHTTETEETKDLEIIVPSTSQNPARVIDIAQGLKRLELEKRRKLHLALHKTHFLLLMSFGIRVNWLINSSIIQYDSELYDLISNSNLLLEDQISLPCVRSIVDYYLDTIKCAAGKSKVKTIKIAKAISAQLRSREVSCRKMFNIILLVLLRFLCVRTRLVMNLDVVPKHPPAVRPTVKAKPLTTVPKIITNGRYGKVPLTTTEILKHKPEIQQIFQLSQLDGADSESTCDELPPMKKERMELLSDKPRLWKLKSRSNMDAIDKRISEKAPETLRLIPSKYFRRKPTSKQVADVRENKMADIGMPRLTKLLKRKDTTTSRLVKNKQTKSTVPQLDIWIECFLEKEQRWIVVEAGLGRIDCMEPVIDSILDPPAYVFAWEADGTIIDVSPRYWWRNVQKAVRQRVDAKWLKKATSRYRPKAVDVAYLLEQLEFRQLKLRSPMPHTIAQFKNHPSYCLKRDLQKFQAIYPPDAPPLGFIKGEPIYARECVHILHSREVWLRHAKVIRFNEQPYKVVKSKLLRQQTNLDLFGYWQTEDFIPPEAVNGIVPRNAFGNIELFKECMLPKDTVHLRQYGLSYICRKLKIDYAVAVVGFGIHAGGNHPLFDGIVICEEHQNRLLEAWELHQEDATQRKKAKQEQQVLNNWIRLVKGLLVRRKLKNKYNFDGM